MQISVLVPFNFRFSLNFKVLLGSFNCKVLFSLVIYVYFRQAK